MIREYYITRGGVCHKRFKKAHETPERLRLCVQAERPQATAVGCPEDGRLE